MQICTIACKSVIEALNISTEIEFSTDLTWHAPTCSTYLLLLSYQSQSIYFYKVFISVPYPNHVHNNNNKKNISVVICLCCIMTCFEFCFPRMVFSSILWVVARKNSCCQSWWQTLVNTCLISQFGENVISFNFLIKVLSQ